MERILKTLVATAHRKAVFVKTLACDKYMWICLTKKNNNLCMKSCLIAVVFFHKNNIKL